jgi:hypothetical protein
VGLVVLILLAWLGSPFGGDDRVGVACDHKVSQSTVLLEEN